MNRAFVSGESGIAEEVSVSSPWRKTVSDPLYKFRYITVLIIEQGVTNVEQAEIFLGVDSTTSDEFVLTMYTTKVKG